MIPDEILHLVADLARRELPRETCGFLAKGHDGWSVHPVPNVADDPEREFVMEPQAQIDAMLEIRSSGGELSGTYHSHPSSPPVPSARDLQLAFYPDLVHVIVSPVGYEPEFGMWRITASGSFPYFRTVQKPYRVR